MVILAAPVLAGEHGELARDALHLDDGLDRSLAVGRGVADHDGPPVVLEGARDDLRGGGAEAVDQDRHRPVIGEVLGLVAVDLDLALVALHLDDGPPVDEEPRQLDRLAQVAAPVVAQVEDEALDARLLELHDELSRRPRSRSSCRRPCRPRRPGRRIPAG